jgi:excinuclease ABC subunit A
VINSLVDRGNTVLIIEHNMDIIKTADYIIDMGYDGGEKGGEIIATGTPEQILKKKTYTALALAEVLDN